MPRMGPHVLPTKALVVPERYMTFINGSTAAMDDGARTMGEHQHCGP